MRDSPPPICLPPTESPDASPEDPSRGAARSGAERGRERLEALERRQAVDTPPDEIFEQLALAARTTFGTPVALLNLITEERQRALAHPGIEAGEAHRFLGFCAHVAASGGPLVVTDATQDPRFAGSPFVTGEPGIRFYAGAPLATPDGHAIGTLCVIDTTPREHPSGEQLGVLQSLARAAMAAMGYRKDSARDRTRLERQQALVTGQNRLLALTAKGTPLPQVLEELTRFVEALEPGVKASVLLLDEAGERLQHGAAPSLPEAYTRAIDGIRIGASVGSCGAAAFTGRLVEVADIATDPRWEEYRDAALPHGLRACWSMPIHRDDGHVLGTFALYYAEPRLPTREEKELLRTAADLALIAIERHRKDTELRSARERLSFLLETTPVTIFAFEPTPPHRTTFVSPNIEKVLGYTAAELLRSPSFWMEKLHPDDAPTVLEKVPEDRPHPVYECRILDAAGEYRWVREEVRRVTNGNGEVTELVGYLHDITQERDANERLARANERALREHQELLARVTTLAGRIGVASDLRETARALLEFVEASTPDLAGLIISGFDPERKQRTCLYAAGYASGHLHEIDPASVRPTRLATSLQSRAIRTGEVVIDDGSGARSELLLHVLHPGNRDAPRPRSAIAVPMKIQDVPIGALEVHSTRDGAYDTVQVTALTMAANLAAIAVRNFELFEVQRETAMAYKALAQFGQTTEAMHDIDELVQEGLRSLRAQLGVDIAAFFEFTSEGAHARQLDGTVPPSLARIANIPIPAGAGMMGHVMQTGEPCLVRDYRTQGERALRVFAESGIVTNLALPVKRDGTVRFGLAFASLHREADLDEDAVAIAMAFVRRLENALERAEHLNEISATREATLRALGVALEHRDLETKGHTDRVVALSRGFAREVGLSEEDTQALTWGAYLHDLGKIGIPDAILLKPGRLTSEEFDRIKRHTLNGIEMCRDIPFLPSGTRQVVRNHHERWDGSGYPDGLAGNEIPLLARMFALVDVYDALTSERPYKRAWSPERAAEEIRRQTGAQFDPDLVDTFLRASRPA